MTADKDAVIAALYAAAMGLGEWAGALNSLAELTDTQCITIDTYDLVRQVVTVLASNIAPHQAVEDINRKLGRNKPLIEKALSSLHTGAVYRASELVDKKLFFASDLCRLVYQSRGLKHVMSVFLDVSPQHSSQYTMMKPKNAPDYSDREVAVFEQLKPHLIQSWRGLKHLTTTQSNLHALTELWDHFAHAVFVIDGKRRIHFVNRVGEHLLRDGKWVSAAGGFFRIVAVEVNQVLGMALNALSSGRRQIVSLPHSDRLVTLYQLRPNRIALLVTDAAQSQGWVRGLQIVFQLTPTEAELVTALVQGINLRDYADAHGIVYETARSHLKHAMHKNGWHRQSEMVSQVLQRLLPSDLFNPGFRRKNRRSIDLTHLGDAFFPEDGHT